jgi:hypothetical protein
MISSLKYNPDAVPHVVVLHHVHNPGYVRHLQEQHDLKGTVRPDWICMRVVSLDRP